MLGLEFKSKTIILAILIIAILGISYFIAYPQWTKLSLSKSELEITKQENEKYNKALSEMQTYLDKYKNFQEEISTASKVLPLQNLNSPELINNLANLAKAGGVVLSGFEVIDQSVAKDNKVSVEYSIQNQELALTVSGTYPAIKNFILHLENNLRLLDPQQISFKLASKEDIIQSQIKLKTYYQK